MSRQWGGSKTVWTAGQSIVNSGIKCSWKPVISGVLQRLTLGLVLFSIFVSDLDGGTQCTQPVCRQTGEEWLRHQISVLLFRGNSTCWRTGQTKPSISSTKGGARFCTWEWITPCSSIDWGPSSLIEYGRLWSLYPSSYSKPWASLL